MGGFKDLTGQRFGRLVVVKRIEDHVYPSGKHRVQYECLCDCGNTVNVLSNVLVGGKTLSCGCFQEEARHRPSKRRKDLTGQRFGKLVVLERAENIRCSDGGQKSAWKCICDCGNEVIVRQRALEKGTTKSCGCYSKEWQIDRLSPDLTGQKSGILTAICRTGEHLMRNGKPISPIWLCKCDCGNYKEVPAVRFTRKNTQSCGCLVSAGEAELSSYLDSIGVSYIRQYSFDDLKSKKNYRLRFDFGIVDDNSNLKFLIEYQGIQHYQTGTKFGSRARDETDELKKEYCKKNNIKLYEIRYDEDIPESIDKILKLEAE